MIWPCGLHQSEGEPPLECPICKAALAEIEASPFANGARTRAQHKAWKGRRATGKDNQGRQLFGNSRKAKK